jgi:pyruvate dehydrogenase E2 component (dihydrolipoamide acetyltransferase)
MPHFYRLPRLNDDMEAATLVEWKIAPGAKVKRGDLIAVIESDKGAIDLEIFEDAEFAELLVQPGETVNVGEPLARLAGVSPGGGSVAPAGMVYPALEGGHVTPPPAPSTHRTPPPDAAAAPAPPKITSAARHRALEAGLDPATLTPRHPGGVITLSDVERVLAGLQGRTTP